MPAETFDDLLALYGASPATYRPNLYCFHALGDDGKTTAGTLSPFSLPTAAVLAQQPGGLDEQAIWRGLCARLGGPGRVVVRLQLAAGGTAESIGLQVTDALWRVWGAHSAQPLPAPAPAPVVSVAPAPAAPPLDLLTVMLQGMQQTQQLLIGLVTKPQENPAIAVMQSEILRMQKELAEARAAPVKADKAERQELIDLAVAAAKNEGSGYSAAATLLAGPLDKLSASMASAVETRATIELREAETRQLVAATKAKAAGVSLADVDAGNGNGDAALTDGAEATSTKAAS